MVLVTVGHQSQNCQQHDRHNQLSRCEYQSCQYSLLHYQWHPFIIATTYDRYDHSVINKICAMVGDSIVAYDGNGATEDTIYQYMT